jgi:putative ABC transport system permease protein
MRLLWEGLKLGLASLHAHKLRSSLTLLGHIMGVMTVITLVSIIQGLNHYVSEKILVQGANLFYVDKIGLAFNEEDFLKRLRRPDLELAHYEQVRDRNETLHSVGAYIQASARMKYRDRRMDGASVIGITPDSPLFDPYPLVDGRALREDDVRHRRRIAILGHEVAKELFPVEDPIGKEIRVGSRKYHVVGRLGERGSILGQSTDNFVAVPIN